MKNREYYINSIEAGNIVAFSIDECMFSGKVTSVVINEERKVFTVKTKNSSVYYVDPANIAWVKTGSHWPNGIFNALKESKKK